MPLDATITKPRTHWLLNDDGSFDLREIMRYAHAWARKEVALTIKVFGHASKGEYARCFKQGLSDYMGFASTARDIRLGRGWTPSAEYIRSVSTDL